MIKMRHNFTFMSSNMLNSCWYDDESKELGVTFNNGREYIYEDVEPDTYRTLISAESAGRYFNSIKKELKVKQ